MITSGSVSSVRIGLTIVFAIASTAAPISRGPQPSIETPLKSQSATASAAMFAIHAKMKKSAIGR